MWVTGEETRRTGKDGGARQVTPNRWDARHLRPVRCHGKWERIGPSGEPAAGSGPEQHLFLHKDTAPPGRRAGQFRRELASPLGCPSAGRHCAVDDPHDRAREPARWHRIRRTCPATSQDGKLQSREESGRGRCLLGKATPFGEQRGSRRQTPNGPARAQTPTPRGGRKGRSERSLPPLRGETERDELLGDFVF